MAPAHPTLTPRSEPCKAVPCSLTLTPNPNPNPAPNTHSSPNPNPNQVGAKPDGLMDEIPTVLVHALEQGSGCRAGTENTCDLA